MTTPKQEKWFDYKGFPCVILFQPMGFRCGYVGIPKEHKYYGKDYDRLDIRCHCGLTYGAMYLHRQDDKDTYWIGFDCGHSCDGFDIVKAKELYADDESVMRQMAIMKETGYYAIMNEDYPVRTLEYCEEQCKRIAEQLIEAEG